MVELKAYLFYVWKSRNNWVKKQNNMVISNLYVLEIQCWEWVAVRTSRKFTWMIPVETSDFLENLSTNGNKAFLTSNCLKALDEYLFNVDRKAHIFFLSIS